MASETSAVLSQVSFELSNLALELGLITPEIFTSTKKFSKETGSEQYAMLSADGLIDENGLVEALSKKYGVDFLTSFDRPSLDEKFPKKYCLQNGLLPVQSSDAVIRVGIASPLSLNSLKNLHLMWGKKVSAVFVPFSEFKNGLLDLENPGYWAAKQAKVQDSKLSHDIIDLSKKTLDKSDDSSSSTTIKSTGSAGASHAAATKSSEATFAADSAKLKKKPAEVVLSGDVVNGVNAIFESAVHDKASDIHIEKFRDKARIRFRKNGVLITPPQLQSFIEKNYAAVISRIKIIAGLDIAERRLPQDGGANFVSPKAKIDVDLRISIVPTGTGERAVLRILDKSSLSVNIDQLGFSQKQVSIFKRCIESPQGLVLVTGPTGSGKSTTLYGAINHLNKDDVNILTAEDPVEYTISGISQVQMKDEIGLNFAAALRSFLRQDPEIILVGEIRDAETADIATKAALTGHLVLSTLHTNSAVGAITRLINMGLPKYLVSNALTCVVAQRLVRKLCPKCATSLKPEKIKEYADHPLFHKLDQSGLKQSVGCEACNMTGYASRFAVHEVLEIDGTLKGMINASASEGEIIEAATKRNYVSMMDRGLEFVNNGQTSFGEILRSVPMEAS
jgi:type IV pilus assembly protein PilB